MANFADVDPLPLKGLGLFLYGGIVENLRAAIMEMLTEEGFVTWKGQAPSDIYAAIPPFGTFLLISLEPLPQRSLKRGERKQNTRADWLQELARTGAVVFHAEDPKEILQLIHTLRFELDE